MLGSQVQISMVIKTPVQAECLMEYINAGSISTKHSHRRDWLEHRELSFHLLGMIRASGSMATILREGDGTLFSDPVGAFSGIISHHYCKWEWVWATLPWFSLACPPATGFLDEPLPPDLVPTHIEKDTLPQKTKGLCIFWAWPASLTLQSRAHNCIRGDNSS